MIYLKPKLEDFSEGKGKIINFRIPYAAVLPFPRFKGGIFLCLKTDLR